MKRVGNVVRLLEEAKQPQSDFVKLMEIQAEMEKTQSQIDKFAEDWMEASDKLSLIESVLLKNEETNDENQ